MKNTSFVKGDLVVLICDDAIKYTILSVYGNNNEHTICGFYDTKSQEIKELSVPAIALKKYIKTKNPQTTPTELFNVLKDIPERYL